METIRDQAEVRVRLQSIVVQLLEVYTIMNDLSRVMPSQRLGENGAALKESIWLSSKLLENGVPETEIHYHKFYYTVFERLITTLSTSISTFGAYLRVLRLQDTDLLNELQMQMMSTLNLIYPVYRYFGNQYLGD